LSSTNDIRNSSKPFAAKSTPPGLSAKASLEMLPVTSARRWLSVAARLSCVTGPSSPAATPLNSRPMRAGPLTAKAPSRADSASRANSLPARFASRRPSHACQSPWPLTRR
jgi:hypothetical protein